MFICDSGVGWLTATVAKSISNIKLGLFTNDNLSSYKAP